MTEEQKAALAKMRQPFPENQILLLPRPTKRDAPKGKCSECGGYHGLPAVHLKYVGHAALTDRLLEVDPEWTWEPLAVGNDGYPVIDRDGGMWIKLTICGITRLGYGDAQGKTGGDAMKERIGDALRNAAMRFGAALDLWHKGDLHIEEDAEPAQRQQAAKSDAQPQNIDPKDAEYHKRITTALKTLYGDDKQAALDKVEEMTTFTPKGKTEPVKGVRNFLTLKGDRAKILAANLERLVKEAASDMPPKCERCGLTMDKFGNCPDPNCVAEELPI